MLAALFAKIGAFLVGAARKAADAPVPVPRAAGFFTTDFARTDQPIDLTRDGDTYRLVFQRTGQNLKPLPAARVGLDGEIAYAMDALPAMDNDVEFKNAWAWTTTGGVPDNLVSWYASQSFIGYQMCALLAQHWLINKACTMPARDATRNGYELTVNDGTPVEPEVLDYIRKLDKRFKIKAHCREFARFNRIFGIRIAMFQIDGVDYELPFNPDGIQPNSYKGIAQIDPYWITPELTGDAAYNPASTHFYEPTYWRINGKRIHRSHLVIVKTCEVPDVLKPTYYWGGVPLPQMIYERVYAAERTANEAPQLAMTKRLTVLSGVDMLAAAGNENGFREKLAVWASYRDNYGVKVCGGTEKVDQFDLSLTDLDETIMTQFQLVAAIAEVPATKLLGTTPKGFNSTGEYEEDSYHECLESIQEHELSPLVERHHLIAMRSYVAPRFGIKPFDVTTEWNEVASETAAEKADRTFKEAERDLHWAQSGAIDGIDIRDRLIKDKNSGYNGIEEALPEGPRPQTVIDPGAPKTAPNDPTTKEQDAPPKSGGFGN